MGPPYVDPERSLVAAAKEGDEHAMAQLWRGLNPLLLRYLRGRIGDGAEDVAASAWLDAARGLLSFEGDDAAFRAWLFTIARRRLVDEVRRRERRRELVLDAPPDTPVTAVYGELDDLVRALALVRMLPPDQADAVPL